MRFRYEPEIRSNSIRILFEIMFSIKCGELLLLNSILPLLKKKCNTMIGICINKFYCAFIGKYQNLENSFVAAYFNILELNAF